MQDQSVIQTQPVIPITISDNSIFNGYNYDRHYYGYYDRYDHGHHDRYDHGHHDRYHNYGYQLQGL